MFSTEVCPKELHNIWEKNPVEQLPACKGDNRPYSKKNRPLRDPRIPVFLQKIRVHITDKWFGQDQDLHPGLNWYNINITFRRPSTASRKWKRKMPVAEKKQQYIRINIDTSVISNRIYSISGLIHLSSMVKSAKWWDFTVHRSITYLTYPLAPRIASAVAPVPHHFLAETSITSTARVVMNSYQWKGILGWKSWSFMIFLVEEYLNFGFQTQRWLLMHKSSGQEFLVQKPLCSTCFCYKSNDFFWDAGFCLTLFLWNKTYPPVI